jgi:hypothetical protein
MSHPGCPADITAPGCEISNQFLEDLKIIKFF